jgi:hypothetical protein
MMVLLALIIVLGISFYLIWFREDDMNTAENRHLNMLEDLLKVKDFTKCEHELRAIENFEKMISKYGYYKLD